MIICKNCGAEYEGKFCNHCGQKASVGRLNWHYLWHEAQHNLLHFDRNLITVLKNLFVRPAAALHEYIDGKRARHFSPFSMIVAFGAASGLLFHFFHIPFNYSINEHVTPVTPPPEGYGMAQILYWLNEHQTIDVMVRLPIYAFLTWAVFRKPRYNFVEHLAVNAFCGAQILIIFIVTVPFLLIFKGSDDLRYVLYVALPAIFIVPASTLVRFFNESNVFVRILKAICIYLLPGILINKLVNIF